MNNAISAALGPTDGKSDEKANPIGSNAGFRSMLSFLFVVTMIEGADVQLLPASFRAMEVTLGLTPAKLGLLALSQALATNVCTPVWGSLADQGYSRKKLLAFGAFSWGILTLALSSASSYHVMLCLRILNGMALGSLSPISQSLLVDATAAHERGKFFGGVQFFANIGSVSCAVCTASVSMHVFHTPYGNVQGWRLAFALVANASIMLSFFIFMYMPEPPRRPVDTMPTISGELSKVARYLRIPTFRVIVLQGLFGCIPWSALSFIIFYFQYVGISDFGASILFAFCMGGGALGGIVGGLAGDRLAAWSPAHGRPLAAQISVAAGIPLIAIVLYVIPREPEYYKEYAVVIFIFGVMASWCSAGINRPILSEIVEEQDRASVFAWLITIDGSFAALFGAPMVGFLAENAFGYKPSEELIANMPPHQREMNAAALGNALVWCCVLPWLLCLICFSFLHVTYGQDLEARKETQKLTQ